MCRKPPGRLTPPTYHAASRFIFSCESEDRWALLRYRRAKLVRANVLALSVERAWRQGRWTRSLRAGGPDRVCGELACVSAVSALDGRDPVMLQVASASTSPGGAACLRRSARPPRRLPLASQLASPPAPPPWSFAGGLGFNVSRRRGVPPSFGPPPLAAYRQPTRRVRPGEPITIGIRSAPIALCGSQGRSCALATHASMPGFKKRNRVQRPSGIASRSA